MKTHEASNEFWKEARAMRPRLKDVAYQECLVDDDLPVAPRVPYEQLSRLLTDSKFARLSSTTDPGDLTADLLKSTGFQDPILVKPGASVARTRERLGMRAPDGLDAAAIAERVGRDVLVPTISVETQQSGPRMTLGQWAEYFEQQPGSGDPRGRHRRQPLLNVVSLSLAGTPLQADVQAPLAVRAVDLVDAVWPPMEEPRPEVLLYALMSPAGAYTDFHIDFGASSVWYHLISGRKTFVLVPPTPSNLAGFESWASSEKQAGRFFGHEVEGALLAELGPGDTMLIPASWPHAVATLEDSVVVGGNFLHALDLRRAVDTWDMESRLGVGPHARFPLFRQLMWRTAAHYHAMLRADSPRGGTAAVTTGAGREKRSSISAWEMSGIAAVLPFLRRSLRAVARFGPSACPPSINDPPAMLQELDAAVNKMMPFGLTMQEPDFFMDLDPALLEAETGFGDGYEGILLEGDGGLHGAGDLMPDPLVPPYDSQLLDWDADLLQQQWQQQPQLDEEPCQGSGSEAPSDGNQQDDSEWSGADDAEHSRRQRKASEKVHLKKQSKLRRKRVAKRKQAPESIIRVTRRAPDDALLVKLSTPRARTAHEKAQEKKAAAVGDNQCAPNQRQHAEGPPLRGSHANGLQRSPEEAARLKAKLKVWQLRSRMQRDLALQVGLGSGQVRLRDGGERLRTSMAATAAELAAALHASEAAGNVEDPWSATAFADASLTFIDSEGRVQGPFSLAHLKLLAEDNIISPDTLVIHPTHSPSLFSIVLAMPSAEAAPSQPMGTPSQTVASAEHGILSLPENRDGCGVEDIPRAEEERSQSGEQTGSSGRMTRHQEVGASRSQIWSRGRSPVGDTPHQNRHPASPGESRRPYGGRAVAMAEAARARRKAEAAARAADATAREAAALAEAAAKWARRRRARACHSLQQEVLAQALEVEAAMEGSWTCLGQDGSEQGPYTRTELLALFKSGKLPASTMVHDEDEGLSVQLSALVPARQAAHPQPGSLVPPPAAERPNADTSSHGQVTETAASRQFHIHDYQEPVSPAVDMELSDDEEAGGGRQGLGGTSGPSQGLDGAVAQSWSSHVGQHTGQSSAEEQQSGGDDPPPPPPPDSPPPPPPLPPPAASRAIPEDRSRRPRPQLKSPGYHQGGWRLTESRAPGPPHSYQQLPEGTGPQSMYHLQHQQCTRQRDYGPTDGLPDHTSESVQHCQQQQVHEQPVVQQRQQEELLLQHRQQQQQQQQQRPLGLGVMAAHPDALGSMLQSIMHNVHSAGSPLCGMHAPMVTSCALQAASFSQPGPPVKQSDSLALQPGDPFRQPALPGLGPTGDAQLQQPQGPPMQSRLVSVWPVHSSAQPQPSLGPLPSREQPILSLQQGHMDVGLLGQQGFVPQEQIVLRPGSFQGQQSGSEQAMSSWGGKPPSQLQPNSATQAQGFQHGRMATIPQQTLLPPHHAHTLTTAAPFPSCAALLQDSQWAFNAQQPQNLQPTVPVLQQEGGVAGVWSGAAVPVQCLQQLPLPQQQAFHMQKPQAVHQQQRQPQLLPPGQVLHNLHELQPPLQQHSCSMQLPQIVHAQQWPPQPQQQMFHMQRPQTIPGQQLPPHQQTSHRQEPQLVPAQQPSPQQQLPQQQTVPEQGPQTVRVQELAPQLPFIPRQEPQVVHAQQPLSQQHTSSVQAPQSVLLPSIYDARWC